MTVSQWSNDASFGIEQAVGYAAPWKAAGVPVFLEDTPHAYATREVVSAPSSGDIGLFGGETPWQHMRGVAMGVLANGALLAGCAAFEVRLTVAASGPGATRVQMFLTAMVRDWHQGVAQSAVEAACANLPPGFITAAPVQDLGYGGSRPRQPDEIVVELRRDEEVTAPQWDYIPADFYYTIADDPGDGSGWPSFWRSLSTTRSPVTISLLFAGTELHPIERDVLGSITTDLSMYAQPRTEYDFLGNPATYPACENAAAALESWQKRIRQLNRPLLARVAVRAEVATAARLAGALAAAIGTTSGVTGSHPMLYETPRTDGDTRQADFSFDWMEIIPWGGHGIWTEPDAPMTLRRLPYLFGINEAASLLVLPVPDEQGVPGMPRTRRASSVREAIMLGADEQAEQCIRLGTALNSGEDGGNVMLPLSAINRHALVVGAPGSGKTTTVLSLLVQLWRDHQIPFLVIESVKAEYRTLLDEPGLEDLRVITFGNERVSPLRLNPLEPPPGVRCEVQMGSVMASLKMALPLFPPLPQILSQALSRTYREAGWDDETTISDGITPPTLRDLLRNFELVFEGFGWHGQNRDMAVSFRVRLESLLQGSRGKLLDTARSSDFSELLSRPLVIEMNEIQEADERAVLAAFVLDRIRAAAKQRGSSGGKLKHVTVIEEAHRLLAKAHLSSGEAGTGDQGRADSVRAFCDAIAELRSLGEGFVLSSQSPSVLADAAVANSGSRILHAMRSSADRSVMLSDLGADDQLSDVAAHLRKGEAIASWPERDEIALLKVDPGDVDSGRPVSDDAVAERMAAYRAQVAQILPYQLCSPEVCSSGCTSTVRSTGRSLAESTGRQARDLWQGAPASKQQAVTPIAHLLAARTNGQLPAAYCGAVHLSLQGDALRTTPGIDDRPTLISALRHATGAHRG